MYKTKNIICELVMVTYDIGPSLSPFVANVIKVIENQDKVTHLLTPMGSVLEGTWEDVMALIETLFSRFCDDFERLGITLKIDYRRSKKNRLEGKISSVREKLKT